MTISKPQPSLRLFGARLLTGDENLAHKSLLEVSAELADLIVAIERAATVLLDPMDGAKTMWTEDVRRQLRPIVNRALDLAHDAYPDEFPSREMRNAARYTARFSPRSFPETERETR